MKGFLFVETSTVEESELGVHAVAECDVSQFMREDGG